MRPERCVSASARTQQNADAALLSHLEGNGSQQAVESALPISRDYDQLVTYCICIPDFALHQSYIRWSGLGQAAFITGIYAEDVMHDSAPAEGKPKLLLGQRCRFCVLSSGSRYPDTGLQLQPCNTGPDVYDAYDIHVLDIQILCCTYHCTMLVIVCAE